MPRVTVIIATYNWSSVLPYSIGSVLRQTFADFELLVVGDHCTDDSAEVVASIGDARVRWINLPENTRHQSGPNNEGLRQARGELIAYLGHDDLWLPHHLASLVAAMDASADVAATMVASIPPDDGPPTPYLSLPRYFGTWIPPSALMHRKAVTDRVGGWPYYRSVEGAPEQEMMNRARAAGFRFTLVPRLSVLKFPAYQRRDAYKLRSCDEQRRWTARLAANPDFEVVQFGSWLAEPSWVFGMRYRELLRHFIEQTRLRLRARLRWPQRGGIDANRKYKGL
ncbi:MAG TPA: glycosyltransferase family A protein [Thermoanaerobaculia bacterium]|jgi:glycosyltransferase involved in cell wall biosynthesis